jgi:hypothetical protein
MAAERHALGDLLCGQRAAAAGAERAHDPGEHAQVHRRDEQQERPRDRRAEHVGDRVERRPRVGDRPDREADAEAQRDGEHEDHGRVPEREEQPDAERPAPVGHELAGRVVDRGDVVGVERVAQAERVRGQPDAGGERTRRPHREVRGHDDAEQQAEADGVECDHDGSHGSGAGPLGPCERAADATDARHDSRICSRSGSVGLREPR